MEDANLTSRALTDLQLVPETVQAVDGKTRRRYEDALKFGNLPCAYTKVMLLGDSGVGKTSTKKLLMGEKHETDDGQSTFGIDKFVVNDQFKPVEHDGVSELAKAAAYFTIHGNSNLLSTVKTPLYLIISRRLWLLLGFVLTFALGIVLFCFQGIEFGYTPVLVAATMATSMLLKNLITGFNIGNGLAIVLVTVNYLTSVDIAAIFAEYESKKHAVFLFGVLCCTGLGYLMGFVLAIGCGAGLSIAVCLMLPPTQKSNVKPSIDVNAVLYLGVDDLLRASKALLLIVFFVAGVTIQSKVDNRKLTIVLKMLSVITAAAIVNVAIYVANISLEWILLVCGGLTYGLAFINGQRDGRKMSKIFKIGYVNRVFTDFLGWEIGTIFAHYLGWRLSFADLTPENLSHMFLSIFGVVLSLSLELYRWRIATNDSYPVDLVRRQIRDNAHGEWPLKYCLLDCAGNELYHVGHHIFMAKHSVYLIVFSLEDAYLRPEWQLERLLYWLNSVFSHARHRDALVFLVGTFMASLESHQIDAIGQWLYNELYASFAGRLAMNEKRKRRVPLFAVENRFRIHNSPDLIELQAQIKSKVSKAEYASRPIPLKWLAFYDFIAECRGVGQKKGSLTSSCIFDYHELFKRLRDPCGFEEEAEYFRMLQFYADFGEIFFRPNDARLFRDVILDPKILIDSVEALAGRYDVGVDDPYIERAWDRLENSGIASKEVIVNILDRVPGETAANIRILKNLELLIPVHGETSGDFIVPFRLPLNSRNQHNLAYDKIFYFDFGYFYPEVIFMNLLAKCHAMTRWTVEHDNVRISERDMQFYKDSGTFYFGDSIAYSVKLQRPSPSKNIITVSARRLTAEAELTLVFRQIDTVINLIRMKHFEFLTYECGFLCHCFNDGTRDDIDSDRFHLNVVGRHGTTHDFEFPKSGQQKFLCRSKIAVIDFGSTMETAPVEEEVFAQDSPTARENSSAQFPRFDVFISCCRDDRPWVQCELLPVLENSESPFRDVGFFDKPTVSVKVNYVENPNPNMNNLSMLEMNAGDIVECKAVVVVISRDYLIDARCTRELDFIVKRHVTIIPVVKDGCRIPDSLAVRKPLDYESCRKEGTLLGRFYLPLIYAVKQTS